MKFYKLTLLLTAIGVLTSCASQLIDMQPGSDRVSVADINQVAHCESKGKVKVSVLSEVGFISRSAEAVESNLLQLARNSAVDANADTIIKGGTLVFGERTFDLYKCRP